MSALVEAEAAGATCSLGPAELATRLALIRERAERWAGTATVDGSVLVLCCPLDAAPELERLVALERECCPSLSFDLSLDSEGATLRIEAPADAAEFAKAFFDAFRQGEPAPKGCGGSACGCT